MATVVVAFDGTRLSAAESETDGGTWDQWDSAKSPAQEPDIVYQFGASNAAISAKVGTSEAGVEFEATSSVNFTSPKRVVLLKVAVTNYAALNTIGPTALVLYVGSGTTTDRYNYYVHGKNTYPKTGGWVFVAIDPNVTAYRDATDGTPSLTAVAYYAISCTFTATSKAENVVMDAVDYFTNGKGLTLTRGDGGSPVGTFQDFIDLDEGTASNRWGLVRSVEGVLYALCTLTVGESATATVFSPFNRTVVFPDSLVDVGFSGLAFDIQNAGTTIDPTDCTFVSRGKSNKKVWFDTENEVNGTTDDITAASHGFILGQAVLYSRQGGSQNIGPTDATQYWVGAITTNTFALYATRQAAMTAGTKVNLTASTSGNGEQHSCRRQPDTRSTLTVTGTSGTVSLSGCSFEAFRLLTLTSAATLTACKFVNCTKIDAVQGLIDQCTITQPLLTEGEAFLKTPDLADITDNSFEIGADGHALEIDTAGTYAFTGNTLTGYWTHGDAAGGGAKFHTTNDVNGTTEVITTAQTHGFTTGDAVYYNKGGGSAAIGLTDGARYYVEVITTTTLGLHVTKAKAVAASSATRVNLTSSGTETHALYSTKAAILNSSGGAVTINVADGTTPYVRNSGASTTTVNNNVSVTFDKMKDNTEVRVYATSGGAELAGIETATAGTTDNRNFVAAITAGTNVRYVIINNLYDEIHVKNFTWPSTAQTINIQQRLDRNYSNP